MFLFVKRLEYLIGVRALKTIHVYFYVYLHLIGAYATGKTCWCSADRLQAVLNSIMVETTLVTIRSTITITAATKAVSYPNCCTGFPVSSAQQQKQVLALYVYTCTSELTVNIQDQRPCKINGRSKVISGVIHEPGSKLFRLFIIQFSSLQACGIQTCGQVVIIVCRAEIVELWRCSHEITALARTAGRWLLLP